MSNSQRSISFTIGLMGTLFIMMLVTPLIPDLFFSSASLLYAFMYIFLFVILQNGYKYLITHRMTSKSEVFLSTKPIQKAAYDRLYYYGILILIAFPQLRTLHLSYSFMIQLLLALVIIEVLFRYGSRSLQVSFSQIGISINGFDPRIDIPLNAPIYNHPGFYIYSDIAHYSFVGNHLEVTLHNLKGTLRLYATMDMQRQLMGLFQAKGVPAKVTESH